MRNITADELKTILERHALWLNGADDGERANLSFADLRFADLSSADLSFADLRSADLRFANLSSADLSFADLRFADLSFADLRSANLRSANLRFANLSSAENLPAAPVIPNLDAQILEIVTSEKGELEMSAWHTCETTHCRAGWAITLAGDKGAELEKQYGPSAAGALIYFASTGRVPNFIASNEDALDDMRSAAQQSAPAA